MIFVVYERKKIENDERRIKQTVRMDGRVKENGSVSGIERLLLAIEKGRTLGGIRNVEATEILRRSEETDFGASEGRLTN